METSYLTTGPELGVVLYALKQSDGHIRISAQGLMMGYSIELFRIGPRGTCEGPRATFTASSAGEAITLAKSELEKMPRSPSPVTFSIYDQSKRMVLSYTSAVRPQLN